MTNNITVLGIGVDSSGVLTANQAFKQFVEEGHKAESAATAMERANAALVAELRGIGSGIQHLIKLAEAQKKAAAVSRTLAAENAKVTNTSKQASAAIQAQADATDKLAAKSRNRKPAPLSINPSDTKGARSINEELSAAATSAARAASEISTLQKKARQTPPISFAQRVIRQPSFQPNGAVPSATSVLGAAAANASGTRNALNDLTYSVNAQVAAFAELDAKARHGLATTSTMLHVAQEAASSARSARAAIVNATGTAKSFSNNGVTPSSVRLGDVSALTKGANQADAAIKEAARDLAALPVTGLKAVNEQLTVSTNNARRAAVAVGNIQPRAAVVTSIRASQQNIGKQIPTTVPLASSAALGLIRPTVAARDSVDGLTYAIKSQSNALAELRTQAGNGMAATLAVLRAAADEAQRLRNFNSVIAGARTLATGTQGAGVAPTQVSFTPQSSRRNSNQPVQAALQSAAPQAAAATAASRALTQAHNDQARATRLAAFQQQQLGFQLHDFFVQVTSGQSPLTAFVQQGSQLSGTFGGAGNAFRAVLSLITPVRLGFAGIATAIAAIGYAAYKSSEQQKTFKNSILLTGNFAGQTYGRFNEVAEQASKTTHSTIGQSKEVAQALLSTGEIGEASFSKATQAALLWQKATDKTTEAVAADFVDMARAPVEFATKVNRQFHFLGAGQLEAIKNFEENGQTVKALDVIYDAMSKRMGGVHDNMSRLDRALEANSEMWSRLKDSIVGAFDDETVERKITKLQAQLKRLDTQGAQAGVGIGDRPFAANGTQQDRGRTQDGSLRTRTQNALNDAIAEKAENDRRTGFQAENDRRQAAAATGRTVIDGYLKRAKATEEYKKKVDELTRSIEHQEAVGDPLSAADQKIAFAQLQKEFINPETQQVQKANLDGDLKKIQDSLQAERDAVTFQNRYLQGLYQNGQVSLETFFKDKRETIAASVEAEVAALDKERARLEQYKRETKDPSERVQTQTRIDEIDVQKNRVVIEGQREQVLTNQEASASFRALDEQVINYRANLLQLQGDEAGAARERAKSTIANAKILAEQVAKTPGATPIDVDAVARATSLVNDFNEVQRRAQLLSAASASAENAFLLAAEQRGASLRDTEQGLYAARARELQQLRELAAKAKELADASTDPRIKQFAADLALEYAKAAAAVDPALNRLRDATRQLAADLTNTVTNLPQTFADAYARRRQQSLDDITSQKSEFDHRIDILEGYLAESQDKQDKARLRAKIKDLQSQKDGAKGKSRVSSLFGAFNDAVIQPVGQQVFSAANKVLIADPLQKYLETQLKSATDSDNGFGKALREALGVKVDPKEAALAAQTAAITSSTTALSLLEAAARGAADGIASKGVASPGGSVTVPTIGPDSENGDAVDAFGSVVQDTTKTTADFALTVPTATDVITKLAAAGGSATQSLALLPSIISLISASSATSAGNGIFGSIAKVFGFGGGDAGISDFGGAGIFHDGGIVGSPSQTRYVASSMFKGAQRYHTGGLIGRKADGLKRGEVPAILLPDEEVLKRSDPRHRHNLASGVFEAVQQAEKHSRDEVRSLFSRLGVKKPESAMAQAMALPVQGNREIGGSVSAGGMYRVNERGPELLQVAGKQYLMMGNQAGKVEPTSAKGGQTIIHQTIHFSTNGQPVDRRTADQLAAAAGAGARRATARMN